MQEHIWIDWLFQRGITTAVIEETGLCLGTHWEMGSSIVIPIHDVNGNFAFNKYRRNPDQGNVTPKYKYDKGTHVSLYLLHKIKEVQQVLITEGELDTLVAWSRNIPAVSSTGGSMSFQEEWKQYFEGKDVTICFDNDKAGGDGMVRALKILPDASVLFLPDRPGVKDISDYVGSGGDLVELMRSRVHFDTLQDVIDDRSVRLSMWQSTWFHDAYIAEHTQPEFVRTPRPTSTDGDLIERAKTYPITDLVKFNKDKKALCIWHNEKTPSLHYFKETNTVYCFGGCGKRGDAIDVYRVLNGCSFKEAVAKLI